MAACVTALSQHLGRNLEAGMFPLWRDLRTLKKAAR